MTLDFGSSLPPRFDQLPSRLACRACIHPLLIRVRRIQDTEATSFAHARPLSATCITPSHSPLASTQGSLAHLSNHVSAVTLPRPHMLTSKQGSSHDTNKCSGPCSRRGVPAARRRHLLHSRSPQDPSPRRHRLPHYLDPVLSKRRSRSRRRQNS